MNSAAIVGDARSWANELVQRESRGPGDTENAMHRVCQRYGLDFNALWSLRYRPPKRVFADVYLALKAARDAERDRQLRLLQHDIAITEAITGPDHPRIRAAKALVSQVVDPERQ